MEADNATEDNDMYGIHHYCPRCGGHRLLKLHGRTVLIVCSGCGLMTEEKPGPAAPPASFDTNASLEVVFGSDKWPADLPVYASPEHQQKNP
jgi:uncharacterized protein (DUF983 family)